MREIYCIEQIGRKPHGKKEFETHIREQLNDMFTNEDWYGIDPDQTKDENDKSRLNQDKGQLVLSSALRLTFYSNATDKFWKLQIQPFFKIIANVQAISPIPGHNQWFNESLKYFWREGISGSIRIDIYLNFHT